LNRLPAGDRWKIKTEGSYLFQAALISFPAEADFDRNFACFHIGFNQGSWIVIIDVHSASRILKNFRTIVKKHWPHADQYKATWAVANASK